jgi:hypothetical protein
MLVWALRDRKTGEYLPAQKGDKNPTSNEFNSKNPRLFHSRGAASNCLNAWRCGHWHRDYDGYPTPLRYITNFEALVRERRTNAEIDMVGFEMQEAIVIKCPQPPKK